MVRTYAVNPSTSTNNFTNLFVEDNSNHHKLVNDNTYTVGVSNKSHSAQFVNLPTPFNSAQRQYEQNLRSSLRISRANSLPLSALSREQWIQQQQQHQPLLRRRQSYVEDNLTVNQLESSQILPLLNPINAVNLPSTSFNQPQFGPVWISPYGNNFVSAQQNNVDFDEQQYLDQQKQLIYAQDDLLIKPADMSYGVYQQNQYSSTPNQQPPSYGVDYEKYLKAQEKEQQAQYLRDLQQQAQQQKTKRLLTEVDYGGYEFEKELRKDQQNRRNSPRAEELPPWLRGNPQPKNGIRGNPVNSNLQPNIRREKSLPVDFNGTGLSQSSYGYGQPTTNNAFGGSSYALNNASAQQYSYKADLERQIQERQMQKQRNKMEDDRLNKMQEQQVWDPWGKGGAGAPIRDKDGKLVADRSQLQQSWNKVLDTNLPHNLSPNNSMNLGQNSFLSGGMAPSYSSNNLNSAATYPTYGSSPSTMPLSQSFNGGVAPPMSEKDAYKSDLQKQIDDRKRQREYEKQLEKQQDERDRAEFEKYAAKQRQELEAEKEKQRAKQEMAQRKFETMQNTDKSQTNGNGGNDEPSASTNRGRGKKLPNQGRNQPDDGLEWWERGQQTRPRVESAMLPTMKAQNGARPPPSANKSGPNSAAARKPPTATPVAGSRRQSVAQAFNKPNASAKNSRPLNMPPTPPPKTSYESSQTLMGQNGNGGDDSPPMRTKPIKPRSAAVKNEAILRQLSAMRERLNKEQIRVKSALRRKEYGDDLFSDEDGPTAEYLLKDVLNRMDSRAASNILSNRRSSVQPNRTKSMRPSSTYDDLFDGRKGGKQSTTNDDLDDDPPLVKLIKNSRTSASNFARTPVSNRTQAKKSATMGGNRRSAYSDDESPRISRKPNQTQSGRIVGDDDSDPDAVVEDYISKRTAATKSQSRSLGRNPRPLSTDSLY